MKYNKQQIRAINHVPAPLLIIAGAGTGKTTTIVARMENLIKNFGVNPNEILALTFTIKAAEHLKFELEKRIGSKGQEINATTFHSFSNGVVEEFIAEIGLKKIPRLMNDADIYFLLMEKFDTIKNIRSKDFRRNPALAVKSFKRIFDIFRNNLFLNNEIKAFQSDVLDKRSSCKDEDSLELLNQLLDSYNVYPKYQSWKKSEGLIDFGDMILYLWQMINKKKSAVLKDLRCRYKHIIIDEFQDNNYALSEVIKKIAAPYNSITVVGDDDQSIYGFRGANIYNISSFKEEYSEHKDYLEINLYMNYRSSQPILDIANKVIFENSNRTKTSNLTSNSPKGNKPSIFLGDKLNQNNFIVNSINELCSMGYKKNEIAVLTRSQSQSRKISKVLNSNGLSNTYSSDRLYEFDSVKNILSYINVIGETDKSNISLARLILKKDKGFAFSSNMKTEKDLLSSLKGSKFRENIKRMIDSLVLLRTARNKKPILDIVWSILIDSKEYLNLNRYSNFKNKEQIKALNTLLRQISDYSIKHKGVDFGKFCRFINLQWEIGDSLVEGSKIIKESNLVNVMTIHASKGKEFKCVFIPYLSSGSVPIYFKKDKYITDIPRYHKRWIEKSKEDKELYYEEERRIFYVALTRAKERLFLTTTEKRHSMFIKEFINTNFIERINKKMLEKEKNPFEELIQNLESFLAKELESKNFIASKEIVDSIENVRLIQSEGSVKWGDNSYRKYVEKYIEKHIVKDNVKHIDKGEPVSLSASSIECYNSCSMKYKFRYIDKVPEKPSKKFFQLGRIVHDVAREFHDQELSTKEEVYDLLEMYWNTEGYEFVYEEKQYKEDAKKILENFYNYSIASQGKIISIEEKFKVYLGNCILRGQCDRIDLDEKGFHIIDYKTSKKKKSKKELMNDYQLGVYALYASSEKDSVLEGKVYSEIPSKLSLVFLRDADPEVSINVDSEYLLNYKNSIQDIARKIKGGDFEVTKNEFTCNFCDYKELICPKFS
ncbi:MAG: hypothetical protein CBD58_01580 [bacterium TMED198]|nr:MAG: hypothetical protein CBD58_01580 [bacterium TMED198]